MGKQLDMRSRHTNIRINDHVRQSAVERARKLIFNHGIPLSSNRLHGVLEKFSGVPTRVSIDT